MTKGTLYFIFDLLQQQGYICHARQAVLFMDAFTHSIAAAHQHLLLILKRFALLLSCGKSANIMANTTIKQVSVNDVKNAKAVQQVSNIHALRLIAEMKMHLQSAGGLKSIMQLTKNFAYSLSESKVNDNDLPAVKVGKKSYYLSPVGAVNETNVLNVIKSVLKVEDAKRVLAKRLAKRLSFEQFAALNDTQKRIGDMKAGLKLAKIEMTAKQEKDALHSFYNEYLQTLGLDE